MAPGSVIVDLAAERGGNCELTRPDEVVVHNGVTILGPSNPPALVPYHASQMYSKNITTFLAHLLGKDGAAQPALPVNPDDEITRETLLTRDGEVVHPRVGGAVTRMWLLRTDEQAEPPFAFRILPGSIKTIGRSAGAEFTVEAAMVSRLHCRLTAGATELEVVDLESTNGTFVNGEPGHEGGPQRRRPARRRPRRVRRLARLVNFEQPTANANCTA